MEAWIDRTADTDDLTPLFATEPSGQRTSDDGPEPYVELTASGRRRRPVDTRVRAWDRSEGPSPTPTRTSRSRRPDSPGAYELFVRTLLNAEGVPGALTAYARLHGWVDDGPTASDDFGGSAA